MKVGKTLNFKLTIILFLIFPIFTFAEVDKVIYGEDNRYEVSDYHDSMFQEFAKSVAGKIPSKTLIKKGNVYHFIGETLQKKLLLCSEERFAQQKTIVSCTGFLIAKNILLTAGHCVRSTRSCRNYKWVFDFTDQSKVFPKENVYSCESIIKQKLRDSSLFKSKKDYAIIKLKRDVINRDALKLKLKGKVKKKTKLVVIGHPSGIPLKIADNAEVLKSKYSYYRTNLDTYAGNSGSPVFEQESGKVIGLLIEGANDYVPSTNFYNGNLRYCFRSNILENSQGSEKVFKIKRIKKLKKYIRE